MVPSSNPLCRIDDVFNGVLVDANMVGEVMFYGPGAGKLPTASAVVADIIDIIANRAFEPKPIVWQQAEKCDICDFGEYSCYRMFIVKGNTEALPEGTAKSLNGLTAHVCKEELTENQTRTLCQKLGDSLVSVYRILD